MIPTAQCDGGPWYLIEASKVGRFLGGHRLPRAAWPRRLGTAALPRARLQSPPGPLGNYRARRIRTSEATLPRGGHGATATPSCALARESLAQHGRRFCGERMCGERYWFCVGWRGAHRAEIPCALRFRQYHRRACSGRLGLVAVISSAASAVESSSGSRQDMPRSADGACCLERRQRGYHCARRRRQRGR